MHRSLRAFIGLTRGLGLVAIAILLLGSLATVFHHHDEANEQRPCAACTAGHASATLADASLSTPILPRVELRTTLEPSAVPPASLRRADSPRAPPLG